MTDDGYDKIEETPPMTIEEVIKEIVGTTMDKFMAEHSGAYKAIRSRLGNPLTFVMDHLERDEAFQELLARTDKEVDIANILRVIVPMILKVAMTAFGIA